MKNFLSILLLILFITLLAGPVMVQADGGEKIITIENPLKYDTIEDIIKAITGILRVVAIGIGVIMVIWSGIMIITAGGSEEKLNKGKKTMMWTLIGVAIVISVDFIVGLVKEILAE